MKEKTCPHCEKTMTVDNFYKSGRSYSSWCKSCVKESTKRQAKDGYFKERRKKNPEKCKQVLTEEQKQRKREYERRRWQVKKGLLATARIENKGKKKSVGVSKARTIAQLSSDIWGNAYKRMVREGREFLLTREEIRKMIEEFCENNYHEIGIGKNPFQPSLDRIDSERGYEVGNIRIVWLIENYARNNFSDDQLIEFCRRKLGLPVE